jgi:hypothetical protein
LGCWESDQTLGRGGSGLGHCGVVFGALGCKVVDNAYRLAQFRHTLAAIVTDRQFSQNLNSAKVVGCRIICKDFILTLNTELNE